MNSSYLIIGGGIFGVSTAYHLAQAYPEASIVLVDRSEEFPSPLAASHDFNKIVRADYGNSFYCQLALEARQAWTSDPLYSTFYHQSGLLNIDGTGLGKRIIRNYEDSKVHSKATIIGSDEMKFRYNGIFADANYRGVDEIFINPLSGWAEATLAVKAVVEKCRNSGVKFIQGDVTNLIFDDHDRCTGIKTTDGRTFSADKVILSTGAGTARLLAESSPEREDLQAGDRITAAAVVTGVVKLTSEQMERFKTSPAFIHSIDSILPPTPDGLLKFCVDVSFKNTSYHQKSGQMISAPPDSLDQDQHKIPNSLKNECHRVLVLTLARDGITPNQDFIISSHPCSRNLYIATGGSFHGWKFLPIIGKYVVQMLDGQLEPELQKRWAWNREQTGSAHERLLPQRELRDLL
ncbi:hypothetical protein G7Y89_g6449 [Cudoniella acicularis]|uniref:FAD dependent oxidoreductase domain-containing protein n=1 Tax=Cudoniella acicularis TaxID=354080 RepID=A0A8H4RKH4_9HELO|nr:hypothetical protein G7Y89_g6449 [Cudoniella acicularis]